MNAVDESRPPHSYNVVPASPGWFACELMREDRAFHLTPVIAWAVAVEPDVRSDAFWAHPVLPEGYQTSEDDVVLKDPTGRFIFRDDRTFESESPALAYAIEQHDTNTADKAARRAGNTG